MKVNSVSAELTTLAGPATEVYSFPPELNFHLNVTEHPMVGPVPPFVILAVQVKLYNTPTVVSSDPVVVAAAALDADDWSVRGVV